MPQRNTLAAGLGPAFWATVWRIARLLASFSWQENRHHPWRNLAAVVAVMLGVALAFAVHLINASALSEFSSAVRTVNGQPDLEIRASSGTLPEALYARLAQHPGVALASPVVEAHTYALDAQDRKVPLKVVGVDALLVAGIAPALIPIAAASAERLALFAPNTVFLNPAAHTALPGALQAQRMTILQGLQSTTLTVAGSVNASGEALAVMDIGAAQDLLGLGGQLNRIDLRLQPGTDRAALLRDIALPANVQAHNPGDATERINNLSRAYRVNMTVLALVALFTGAFLVFSVLSLSVAKRAQQFALLGVLGLSAPERLALVLVEAAVLGVVGSVAGLALGTALAALALALLGGDLGGGYFSGAAPPLQWHALAACAYGALGVAAAMAGAWWPARAASGLPLAQTLKGLGGSATQGKGSRLAVGCIVVGLACTAMPPVWGIPLAAFVSIALLLVGGIGWLPAWVALAYDRLAPWVATRALPLLAVERARRVRETAAVAVSGVVAALSLAVALTVMVSSFRQSVMQWLDIALPAPLYVRAAGNLAAAESVYFNPAALQAIARVPGVQRVEGLRLRSLQLAPTQPAVVLVARWIDDPTKTLPLIQGPTPPAVGVPANAVPIYVSEPMVDLYQARLGQAFALNLPPEASGAAPQSAASSYYVAGVWRDYARQFGAIAIDQASYARITGDMRVNDIAVWFAQGASSSTVQNAIGDVLATQLNTDAATLRKRLEFASAAEIRAISLTIFDRSFAVTYWLQAVAIAIGLFGVAASFSAQVLARRKEFGLLAHLGLTGGRY
jgi:putative ABC transport system permease protein